MWVRTSGVWRNFRPDVEGSITKGTSGTFVGWNVSNAFNGNNFGTAPAGNRIWFGDHQLEGLYTVDVKGVIAGPVLILSGSPAAGWVERLTTTTHGLLTGPAETLTSGDRQFDFNEDLTPFTTGGSETFRVGGD